MALFAAMRVHIVQEFLPAYRVAFFESLRQHLAEHGVDLRLTVGRHDRRRRAYRDEGQLPWADVRPIRKLHMSPFPRLVWQPVYRETKDDDLVIVEQANRMLLNYLLLGRRQFRSSPLIAYWGHGRNLQSPGRISEAAKARLLTTADWWFAYTELSAQIITQAGFPGRRVTVVDNAVDTGHIINPNGKRAPYQCVFVGSLHEYKRIDFLLEVGHLLHDRFADRFRLLIVGDGPMRTAVQRVSERVAWLEWLGADQGQRKHQALTESQLLLMPGLVGLAIVEAFAAATPMVTIAQPLHSPEIAYLENGRNGVILPSGTDTTEYAGAVGDILDSSVCLESLREGCHLSAKRYSLANMVEKFSEGVLQALEHR